MATQAQAAPDQAHSTPAGWYVDPHGNGQRYWDGTRWTDHHPPAPVTTSPPPGYGVVHCRGCGQPINPQAAICVHCGVPTGAQPQVLPPRPKSKTTAVLLAVFLGFWTWLYTYQQDSWKFWLNLALAIVTLGIWALVAWVWAIIDVCVRPPEWYDAFPNHR